jgi:DNA-binding XRE family transcriptional regulator
MRPINTTPVHNRLDAILGHLRPYWFNPVGTLAAEIGVSRTTVQRLINGTSSPSFTLLWSIARALEKHMGRPVNPMEIVSVDGTYPTPSPCDLCGCQGCTAPRVYQGRDPLPSPEPVRLPASGEEAA